jgi:probable phosphoglycerate mutase
LAIYLLRHGETPGNAARVLQTPEVRLSERGRLQAERLAQRLSGAGIARILSSDLERAVLTAESLRAASGAPLELEPLLQERSFGDLRGTPYAALGFDPFAADYAPPGGESWAVFHTRVDAAWQRVLGAAAAIAAQGAGGGHLAVVTHGLVCLSLATRHLRLPEGAALARGFANASLSIVEDEPPFAVRLLNCTAHLEGLGGEPAGAA